jgi:hypothetical protein
MRTVGLVVAHSPVQTFEGFLSYAHADACRMEEFLRLFEPRGGIRKDACFKLWDDRALLVGERWQERIATELKKSDFGILLLSPDFFHSPFIKHIELPTILAAGNVVPVGLEAVGLGAVDLLGLEELQVFRFPVGRGRSPRWFADLGPQNRKRFVDALIDEMARRFLNRRP